MKPKKKPRRKKKVEETGIAPPIDQFNIKDIIANLEETFAKFENSPQGKIQRVMLEASGMYGRANSSGIKPPFMLIPATSPSVPLATGKSGSGTPSWMRSTAR